MKEVVVVCTGRRSPRRQREVYRKILSCSLELLDKLGHSYVITTLSREPLFSISEDCEVNSPEGVLLKGMPLLEVVSLNIPIIKRTLSVANPLLEDSGRL